MNYDEKLIAELVEKEKFDHYELIQEGYGGTINLKLTKNNVDYFAKIFKPRASRSGELSKRAVDIEHIKKTLEIYKECDIKTLEHRFDGSLDNGLATYMVYNWILGENAENVIDRHIEHAGEIGYVIGSELAKLREYTNYNKEDFKTINIEEDLKTIYTRYLETMKSSNYQCEMPRYFTQIEVGKMFEHLGEAQHYFNINDAHLIHGDATPLNVIINADGYFLVDCEEPTIGYGVYEIKQAINWFLIAGKKEYIKEYFRGLYNGDYPENFQEQIKYIIIRGFLSYLHYIFLEREYQPQFINYYFSNMRKIIDDLENISQYLAGVETKKIKI